MKQHFLLYLTIGSLLLTAGLGYLVVSKTYKPIPKVTQDQNVVKYPLLSPRVFVNEPNDVLVNFVKLRNELRTMVAQANVPAGVYFEYLPSGVWVGAGEREVFFPTKDIQILETLQDVKPGRNMYEYIDLPESTHSADLVVSPKGFSSVLRALYLATYVDVKKSNELLQKYSLSTDPVAASGFRFGNETNGWGDCSVVYRSKRPYIVCMMAKTSKPEAQRLFSKLFQHIYQYVDSY